MIYLDKNAPWVPRYYTKSLCSETKGNEAIYMAEKFLKANSGFRQGQIIVLADWQKWLLNNLLELNPGTDNMRYRRALVLLPRKNGKTFLASILCLYHLLRGPRNAQIYSAAGSMDIAKLVYDMIIQWMDTNPSLGKILKVNKAKYEIVNKLTKAVYKPLSADGDLKHGLEPFFVIADELHTWKNTKLWQALTTGSGSLPNAQVLAITTAGDNVDDSLLGSLYKIGKNVIGNEENQKAFGFFCWEANEETDNPTDPEVWRKVNPNLAEGLMSIETMQATFDESINTDFSGFLRFHLNIWTRLGGESFISPSFWAEATNESYQIPVGADITVGFDGSRSGDSTGIVIQDIATGHLEVWKLWEKPANAQDWSLSREEVEQSLILLHERYNVKLLWADNSYFIQEVRQWGFKHRWNVTAIPQTASRMKPMANQFLQDVIEGHVTHSGDEVLSRYVMNALASEEGGYAKEDKKHKIDLLVCSVLANGARQHLSLQRGATMHFL